MQKLKNTQDLDISTFSVVGRSKDGTQLGVAVASKFLAVGSYVPAASVYGALATQAQTNMALRAYGLTMLEQGMAAPDILESFFEIDANKQVRQAGIIDTKGGVATYTGEDCKPWAGGRAEAHHNGSFAIQGNLLAGPEVIDAMVADWCSSDASMPLAWRLLTALEAGQAAGGDKRGDQAAAMYVIEKGKGYEGTSDVQVDLRCDDNAAPIVELHRLLDMHDALFAA